MNSAGNTSLPTALVTLADAATPGGNQFGDIVRFFRGNYSDYWAWTDAATDRWERMLNWIGARQISAVDISAITGSFADLNVTGRLAASSISADVQNITVLYHTADGFQPNQNSSTTTTLSEDPRNFDVIEFVARGVYWNITGIPTNVIQVAHRGAGLGFWDLTLGYEGSTDYYYISVRYPSNAATNPRNIELRRVGNGGVRVVTILGVKQP